MVKQLIIVEEGFLLSKSKLMQIKVLYYFEQH